MTLNLCVSVLLCGFALTVAEGGRRPLNALRGITGVGRISLRFITHYMLQDLLLPVALAPTLGAALLTHLSTILMHLNSRQNKLKMPSSPWFKVSGVHFCLQFSFHTQGNKHLKNGAKVVYKKNEDGCKVGDWSEWTKCSVPCGVGKGSLSNFQSDFNNDVIVHRRAEPNTKSIWKTYKAWSYLRKSV